MFRNSTKTVTISVLSLFPPHIGHSLLSFEYSLHVQQKGCELICMSKLEFCNNKADMEILFFIETFHSRWKKWI